MVGCFSSYSKSNFNGLNNSYTVYDNCIDKSCQAGRISTSCPGLIYIVFCKWEGKVSIIANYIEYVLKDNE